MATHDAHLAALEREAFAKGFAQGERAGGEAAGQRGEMMLHRLTADARGADRRSARQMIHQTERQMVELALAVARRVVHREVTLDPDLLIAMARVALERLGETRAGEGPAASRRLRSDRRGARRRSSPAAT